MATIQKAESKDAGIFSFENQTSVKKLSTKDIFPKMQISGITDPIDPKRISKKPTSCLNGGSMVKAGFVFLGTLGIYYLTRTKNIFSYFGLEVKNLKDVRSGEVMKVKSRENALTIGKNLEASKQVDGSSINKITQTYESKAGVVEFKEVKVEEIKSSQKEGAEKRRSIGRRSINIKNPIPDQYVVVGKSFSLTIDGSHVFNSKNSVFLEVTKIPDWINFPLNPTFVNLFPINNTWDIAVLENYAYVTAGELGLQIIDVSNPSNPVFKGSYSTPDNSEIDRVEVFGDYAYVGKSQGLDSSLRIIDITNPSNPTSKGLRLFDYIYDLVFSENYLYDLPANVGEMVLSGNHLYVANNHEGFRIVDISDPTNPTMKGSYNIADSFWVEGVDVSGNYAYVTALREYETGHDERGLHILDVSDPSNVTFKGAYDTAGWTSEVVLAGNYACVTDSFSGLLIIDVSDPSNPLFKGSYDTPHGIRKMAISENYLYTTGSGLQIIDLNLGRLKLSGTPSSAGTYSVSIRACNEEKECAADSFNVIVQSSFITSTEVGAIIAALFIPCTLVFCSTLIVFGGAEMVKQYRNKTLRSESKAIEGMKEEELKELEIGKV
jgi:hypothetical protein